MTAGRDYQAMLDVAVEEARAGLAEGFRSAQPSFTRMDCCLGEVTIVVSRRVTRQSTVRQMPSERQAVSADIRTRSWSQRWLRAGTAPG